MTCNGEGKIACNSGKNAVMQWDLRVKEGVVRGKCLFLIIFDHKISLKKLQYERGLHQFNSNFLKYKNTLQKFKKY